jgi:RND family efflux transporter MFP subunit
MSESILQQSKKAKGLGGLGKRKKAFIIIAVLAVGAYFGYNYFFKNKDNAGQSVAQQKTVTVTKGDIKLAVETDGTVTAEDGVELSFSTTGETVEKIYVKEGDVIKQGDKIASISTDSLQFSLKNAQDSYQAALLSLSDAKAGATEKEIKNAKYQIEQAESNLSQAKTSLEQTKIDSEEQVKDAEEAIKSAQDNLKLDDSGNSGVIDDTYEDLYSDIENLSMTIKNHLYTADKILGIDEENLNDDFEGVLGALNSSSLNASKSSYELSKSKKEKLDDMIAATDKSDHVAMDALAIQAEATLSETKILFANLQNLLDATITSSDLTQSELDSMKSSISSGRSSISSSVSALGNSIDETENAGDSYGDLQKAYDDAVKNLEDVKRQNVIDIANAETSVRNKEIALDQAKMSYEDLIAPLTTSELQNLVMKVNQAKNNLEEVQDQIADATLTSPIDGQVGNINGKEGSLISDNNSESFVTIMNKETLFVKVSVEESDVNSIEKGQKAYVTFDAIDGLEIEGEVTYISMTASASSSGVVTYEVRVVLQNVGETDVREGMTAFVSFVSDEVKDVLMVPVAAVSNVKGVASVKLSSGSYQEVVTGFTDGKMVEIFSGLEEGDKIVY